MVVAIVEITGSVEPDEHFAMNEEAGEPMRVVSAHVESGVGMAYDSGSAAWVYDIDLWGVCGQGRDEAEALRQLRGALGPDVDIVVTERIEGDEQAFTRDYLPSTPEEGDMTVAILEEARRGVVDLLRSCTEAELDWDDADRPLPRFATWRTLRQMGWHIADTESRYYLPATGLPAKPRTEDLLAELKQSAQHISAQLRAVPPDLVSEDASERWTTVKLLRRLAWHERAELSVMRSMLHRARSRPSS